MKKCSGGKENKQRNTWAFFVNAAGRKEKPVIIGHAGSLRCFKNLRDRNQPYGYYYFSDKKAWMTNEIMTQILTPTSAKAG